MTLADSLKEKSKRTGPTNDPDVQSAEDLVNSTRKGGVRAKESITGKTTTPPLIEKEEVQYLGGNIRKQVVEALLDDVAASRGRWNKTKLMEYIIAKHYGINLY